MQKDYAELLCAILGEKYNILVDREAINANEELSEVVEEMLEELRENEFDSFELHYTALVDFVMEGKSQDEFAEYIRNKADDLAKSCMSTALRKLRHPKYSKKLRTFMCYKDEE